MRKTGENPGHLLFGSDFLDTTPNIQSTRIKIDILCQNLKNRSAKDTVKRFKKICPRLLEIFVNQILDKGLTTFVV